LRTIALLNDHCPRTLSHFAKTIFLSINVWQAIVGVQEKERLKELYQCAKNLSKVLHTYNIFSFWSIKVANSNSSPDFYYEFFYERISRASESD
jgi:hypothetical protein